MNPLSNRFISRIVTKLTTIGKWRTITATTNLTAIGELQTNKQNAWEQVGLCFYLSAATLTLQPVGESRSSCKLFHVLLNLQEKFVYSLHRHLSKQQHSH